MRINITNIDYDDTEAIKDQLFMQHGNFGYTYVQNILPLELFLIFKVS